MLNLIGVGLGNEKDITLNALDILKNSDFVYLENYTSNIGFKIEDLENLILKKIIIADRKLIEENYEKILKKAKDNNISLLIKGDVFTATTHISLILSAREKKIDVKIFHNASIFTAIGDTGLMLYNFGKIASIPFENKNIEVPIEILENNLNLGMHTLFLLDLKEGKFMNFKYGLNYIIKSNIINGNTKAIICCGLGSNEYIIKYGIIKELLKLNLEIYPQCLIIPGKLHFIEEEALKLYMV